MKIIHGENQVASRNVFLEYKKATFVKNSTVIELDGSNLNLPDLSTAIETSSLFADTNSVFIENFFSRRPSTDKKKLIDYLAEHQTADVYLWDSKDVSTQLTSFNSQYVSRFDLPKHIFSFLDNLDLDSYHECLKSLPAEQLFASLVTRLHKVLLGTGRFKKTFTHAQLIDFNRQLLAIDYKQKTSRSPYDLATALELFLTNL